MDSKKEELINWIVKEENIIYLNKVEEIKSEAEQSRKEFDKKVASGLTLEEFREEMHKRIKSWDWEK